MKKKTQMKLFVMAFFAIMLVIVIFMNRITLLSLYENCNHDHVNLKKGGWTKIFNFVTVKNNISVDIYGRPGKTENSGEFVVARNGLLPFNLQLISPVDTCENVWHSDVLVVDKVYIFNYYAGILSRNFDYQKPNYRFTPNVGISIVYDSLRNKYSGIYVVYLACDEISRITHISDSIRTGNIRNFEKYKSFTYNPDLYKVFPLKGN